MRLAWAGLGAGILGLSAASLAMHQPPPQAVLPRVSSMVPHHTPIRHSPVSKAALSPRRAAPSATPLAASNRAIEPNSYLAGVVEGFYGPTWSSANTIKILQFMSQHYMNTFVYAPKNDPYIRAQWNQPYPAQDLANLKTLVSAAHQNHIQFVVSISPGLSIVYSNPADRAALLNKIAQLQSIGVQTFMLSFDDIPQTLDTSDQNIYGNNLGWAQSDLANYVVTKESAANLHFRLIFTPTVYWGDSANSYWTSLKTHLDPSVDVVWTGPYVLSPTITTPEVQTVQAEIGHPLVIWDNYPVNDYSYVMNHRPQLFMGPLMGREPSVVSAVGGYLFNPMLQPLASEVALWTAGSFLHNPTGYNPQESWQKAVNALGGSAAPAFSLFCQDTSTSYLNPAAPNSIANDMSAFWASYQSHANLTQTQLFGDFQNMAGINAELAQSLSPGLYREIQPWALQLSQQGLVGTQMIEALSAQQKSQTVPSNAMVATLALAHSVTASTLQLGTTDAMNQWINQTESLLPFE